MPAPESLLPLLVAVLGGLAVGIERQWSGHASGPEARFAGLRTFALLGLLAGVAGRLWVWGATALAGIILLGAAALIAVAYVTSSRRDVDATTEVAALVVLAAGVAAGVGEMAVASGVSAVTALLLFEKSRLHEFVARVEGTELAAALRFAVMAVVILPALPAGPFGPLGGVRPRELWLLVLFFSALSFGGYIARRIVGASRGYPLAGLFGGLVSSTSVTLSFARISRDHPELATPLAQGVVAANTVLYLRVMVAAAVLSRELSLALAPMLAMPFVVGAIAVASGLGRGGDVVPGDAAPARNPLQLRSALEMAVVFQVVLFVVYLVEREVGAAGVLATAAVLGLNDADALTLSMARGVGTGTLAVDLAAQAVTVGLLSNTIVKMTLTTTIGTGAFRTIALTVLGLMAAALVAALVLR